MIKLNWLVGVFAGAVALAAPAVAQEITLAYGSAVTSIGVGTLNPSLVIRTAL